MSNLKEFSRDLRADIGELERYSHRWCLKMHGVKEEAGEDLRKVTINIFGHVAPHLNKSAEQVLDVAHRIGKQRQD